MGGVEMRIVWRASTSRRTRERPCQRCMERFRKARHVKKVPDHCHSAESKDQNYPLNDAGGGCGSSLQHFRRPGPENTSTSLMPRRARRWRRGKRFRRDCLASSISTASIYGKGTLIWEMVVIPSFVGEPCNFLELFLCFFAGADVFHRADCTHHLACRIPHT